MVSSGGVCGGLVLFHTFAVDTLHFSVLVRYQNERLVVALPGSVFCEGSVHSLFVVSALLNAGRCH